MNSGEGMAAFLAARLDEDEAAAETWREHDLRPLREVKAKRAILAEHKPVAADTPSYRKGPAPFGCSTCDYVPDEGTYGGGLCTTIRILAAIWNDHPNYEQDWQPVAG